MVAKVRILIRQRAHIFQQLEVTKTMRAYIAHNMDENEDLFASLETEKSEATATRKLAEESVSLLKKVKDEKEVSQAEAYWLVEEKTVIAAKNEKAKEEVVQLRRELQNLRVGFATQKEDLEVDYQK